MEKTESEMLKGLSYGYIQKENLLYTKKAVIYCSNYKGRKKSKQASKQDQRQLKL